MTTQSSFWLPSVHWPILVLYWTPALESILHHRRKAPKFGIAIQKRCGSDEWHSVRTIDFKTTFAACDMMKTKERVLNNWWSTWNLCYLYAILLFTCMLGPLLKSRSVIDAQLNNMCIVFQLEILISFSTFSPSCCLLHYYSLHGIKKITLLVHRYAPVW